MSFSIEEEAWDSVQDSVRGAAAAGVAVEEGSFASVAECDEIRAGPGKTSGIVILLG